MSVSRERWIEDAIIKDPAALGYPGATAIRNVRVGWRFGRADIMLFPRSGRTKLVLVEAKTSSAPDSICKVIGQLLMYYAGALSIGHTGLAAYRRFAAESPQIALRPQWTSPKQITGGITPPAAAWQYIESGPKLGPQDVALYIALNSEPHDALRGALEVLREGHDLHIGLVVVRRRRVELVFPAEHNSRSTVRNPVRAVNRALDAPAAFLPAADSES